MALAPDIQQQVYDILSRSSNISFVSTEQEPATRLGLVPGQRVMAEVLTLSPQNHAQVRIGTERFNLELPMAVRQGQTLEMTFVSEYPRTTFAIARQSGATQPVSLSDASRLLGLLVGSEQIADPKQRSAFTSISDMLRRSAGEAGVLANLMDEALTYGTLRESVKPTTQTSDDFLQQPRDERGATLSPGSRPLTPEQARLAAFESNASQILRQIARSSRFTLVDAANQPVVPLPLMPGEEVNASVIDVLPGGRAFVNVAGTTLELGLPKGIQPGEILRLTYIASHPKPLFALPRLTDTTPSILSEAGRWLSVLEHSPGGLSDQQLHVLDRLNAVLTSLPPGSPAYSAILDEAGTYQTVMKGRTTVDGSQQNPADALQPQQQALREGNGIILNDTMAKLLQGLIRGNRLALLEVPGQQIMPPALLPGQQIKGEVLGMLGGGRFLVQIAGQTLELNLPRGINRGDRLNLFFISQTPQPTFLLARTGTGGDARVSETGRWLSGFLGEAAQHLPAQSTMGIIRTLLSEPPADSAHLGRVLQQGLKDSGLFYESHLARWFEGDYPLEDIFREPQGQLSPRHRLNTQEQTDDAEQFLPATLTRATARTASPESMEAMLKRAGTDNAHEGIADQRALPLIREQMEALQTGQLIYRGDLFPGQTIQWSVAERDARKSDHADRERLWETSISLTLPRLGQIHATIGLEGNAVDIKMRVAVLNMIPILSAGREQLLEQLATAGINAQGITILHDTAG